VWVLVHSFQTADDNPDTCKQQKTMLQNDVSSQEKS